MTGQSGLLQQLCAWYSARCDGDWEHQYGISIETLDNPGWRMRVDLTGTSLRLRSDFERRDSYDEPDNWTVARKSGNIFEGAGAPAKLEAIIADFLEWKDGTDD
jgi:hypothetical protein